jgi:hypothetical protein
VPTSSEFPHTVEDIVAIILLLCKEDCTVAQRAPNSRGVLWRNLPELCRTYGNCALLAAALDTISQRERETDMRMAGRREGRRRNTIPTPDDTDLLRLCAKFHRLHAASRACYARPPRTRFSSPYSGVGPHPTGSRSSPR